MLIRFPCTRPPLPHSHLQLHPPSQARNLGTSLVYGAAKTFTSVPPGFTLETVLVATSATEPASSDPDRVSVPRGGVNAALFSYGDYVLARHAKARARGSHTIETTYLGYSTTGYYFYNLCDCTDVPAATPK